MYKYWFLMYNFLLTITPQLVIMPSFKVQIPTHSISFWYGTNVNKVIDVTVTYSTVDDEDFGIIDSVIKKLISNKENSERIIGFDTWTSNSGSRNNPIAGIALCDGETCLICQLWSFRAIPTSLLNFLRLSTFMFVSSGLKFIMEKLEGNHGILLRNVVEMGPLACEIMEVPPRVESLVCEKWDVYMLNIDQISYVTNNACSYFYALRKKYPASGFHYYGDRYDGYFGITSNMMG